MTRLPLIGLLALLAGPASAATLTEVGGFDTSIKSVVLRAGDFTRVGPCGGGLSVGYDGCSAIPVEDLQTHFGRNFGEIDSQDTSQLWTLDFKQPRSVIQFSVSDIMDMRWSQAFRITARDTSVVDAVWEENGQRLASGNMHYFQLAFDQAVRTVSILFEAIGNQPRFTTSNDGFGVGVCRKAM